MTGMGPGRSELARLRHELEMEREARQRAESALWEREREDFIASQNSLPQQVRR